MLSSLPTIRTNISNLLFQTSTRDDPQELEYSKTQAIEEDLLQNIADTQTSFVANLPLASTKVTKVCTLLRLGRECPSQKVQWPTISTIPINEYNT